MRRRGGATGVILVALLVSSCLPPLEQPLFLDDPSHDFDGDGFAESDGDCDDARPDLSPGTAEVCNGFDDDCDGLVDTDDPSGDGVGMTTWHLDRDGDGYGTAGAAQEACAQPARYVDNEDDCDDGDVSVNPGAEELCNDQDDDCDGAVDDADPEGVLGGVDVYLDEDGDGYGVGDAPTASRCDPDQQSNTERWARVGGDCDDHNPDINPGEVEICDEVAHGSYDTGERTDEDCNGLADDEDTPSNPTTWYDDDDGDGWGSGAGIARCAGESDEVATDGDCNDDPENGGAAVNPDQKEICDDRVDNDCDYDTPDNFCR